LDLTEPGVADAAVADEASTPREGSVLCRIRWDKWNRSLKLFRGPVFVEARLDGPRSSCVSGREPAVDDRPLRARLWDSFTDDDGVPEAGAGIEFSRLRYGTGSPGIRAAWPKDDLEGEVRGVRCSRLGSAEESGYTGSEDCFKFEPPLSFGFG
jgi:hypothetical protein